MSDYTGLHAIMGTIGCCILSIGSFTHAQNTGKNDAPPLPPPAGQAARALLQGKLCLLPGVADLDDLAKSIKQSIILLDRGYAPTCFALQDRDGKSVLTMFLEDENGWGEMIDCDVTELVASLSDSSDSARKMILETLGEILHGDGRSSSTLEKNGSILRPETLGEVESVERIEEKIRERLNRTEGPCGIGGWGYSMRKNDKGEERCLLSVNLRNEKGQTKLIFFDLTDTYNKLEQSSDAEVRRGVAERRKVHYPLNRRSTETRPEKRRAGADRNEAGKTVADPVVLNGIDSLDELNKAILQEVGKRDPKYRVTGFSLIPGSGSADIVVLFLQTAEGWSESVFFDVGTVRRHLGQGEYKAADTLWKSISRLVDQKCSFPAYPGSPDSPAKFPAVASAGEAEALLKKCLRRAGAESRVVDVLNTLEQDRENDDRFLKTLTLENKRGQTKRLCFDMTEAYRRLENADDDATRCKALAWMQEHRPLLETPFAEAFLPVPDAPQTQAYPLPFGASSVVDFSRAHNVVEFHDRLTQYVDDLGEGYRIQGFSHMKSRGCVLVAMHLENREGWRQIVILDLTRISHRIDRSAERAAEKLQQVLDRIAAGVPRFYDTYPGSWGSGLCIGGVHSVVELEKRLRVKIDKLFPGCKVAASRLEAYGCRNGQARFAEVWTLENDRRQRKDVYIELTDAYDELEESRDPATRQKLAERKALNRPVLEPAR